ncbi:MAG: ABC-2 family transporter protein [Caldilineaceae bacterium]|nr:ABC-2 family transporter protein [Caldilineaceae bacterium]
MRRLEADVHLWQIFRSYLRVGLLTEMEYRINFWINLVQSLLSAAVALGALAVVFGQTDNLGGWTPAEMIALLGVYYIIGALIRVIIRPSMTQFMEDVRKGTLDFTLVKPADAQWLISVQKVEIWQLMDLVIGIGLLGLALQRMGERVGLQQAFIFGVTLLAGGLIVYSFWLILSTFAFWFVRVDNIQVIFTSLYEAGRWPITIYPGWLRMMLTFLVPVAFATTVPAQAFTGRLEPGLMLGALALAAFMLIVARLFWRYGLRAYSGASA